MSKIFSIIFIVDLILIIFIFFYGNDIWLINTQFAFIASLLITISSYHSYKKLVDKKVASSDINYDDRDELEKIDDPYDLYDEIDNEKKKFQKTKASIKNLKTSITSLLSPLRILSYIVLFASFLYLNHHNILNIFAYLSGFAIIPISILVSSFFLLSK